MFSPSDFLDAEVSNMWCVVIMTKIGKQPLTNFHKMLAKDRLIFNRELNAYIVSFPDDNWKDILTKDFQNVCCDEIFNEEFQPSKYEPLQINNEIVLIE